MEHPVVLVLGLGLRVPLDRDVALGGERRGERGRRGGREGGEMEEVGREEIGAGKDEVRYGGVALVNFYDLESTSHYV